MDLNIGNGKHVSIMNPQRPSLWYLILLLVAVLGHLLIRTFSAEPVSTNTNKVAVFGLGEDGTNFDSEIFELTKDRDTNIFRFSDNGDTLILLRTKTKQTNSGSHYSWTNLLIEAKAKPHVSLGTNDLWLINFFPNEPLIPEPTFQDGVLAGILAARRNPDVTEDDQILRLAIKLMRQFQAQQLAQRPSPKTGTNDVTRESVK